MLTQEFPISFLHFGCFPDSDSYTNSHNMARVAGISTDKDLKGNIRKVTFDFKKHEVKLRPILVELGVIEEDEFEKEWGEGAPVEEVFDELRAHIDTLKWNK
jgi:hypothetical protein